jgi:hypothetical protein
MADITILLVGQTGSGKTTQLGMLAEEVFLQSGGQKILRYYGADPGGHRSIKPYVNLGLVKPVNLMKTNPWAYEWACDGKMPDPTDPDGCKKKWVVDEEEDARTGAYAFESLTSFGAGLMGNMSARAAIGDNVGGEKIIVAHGNSAVQGGADGISAGGNNRSHYGLAQGRIRDMVYRTHRLPGIIAWTALDSTGEDKEGGQMIVGPKVAGKALIEEVPSWFTYTLHMVVEVPDGEKPRHKMYLMHHRDESAPGALALANIRQPLDAMDEDGDGLPQFIEPASIKELFRLLEDAETKATEKLRARLGL